MAVLVVDDDPYLRQVLERVLSFEGYDALERCQAPERGAAPVDLVILDLGLPDIDGLDVARKLRVSGSTVPIQVLLEANATVVERGALMSEVWGFSSPTLDSNLDGRKASSPHGSGRSKTSSG